MLTTHHGHHLRIAGELGIDFYKAGWGLDAMEREEEYYAIIRRKHRNLNISPESKIKEDKLEALCKKWMLSQALEDFRETEGI